jgi:glucose-1-phosphate cytidylyltransferase
MKTVILCGGRGTRLGEHGATLPKALIDIGGRPILWHLLQLYAQQGLQDFVLCLGHLGDEIKRYFIERHWRDHDLTIALHGNSEYEIRYHELASDHYSITLADTGLDTNTGGRIKRIAHYIGDDQTFCATYGDGLADINLQELLEFHRTHGRIATLTAVHPGTHYGFLKLNETGAVTEFDEKPQLRDWINGGFFVFDRRVFDYLDDNSTLEREPFVQLAREDQLMAYQHTGFWKCMDTYKDSLEFNQLWTTGVAAWKV